MPGGAYRLWDAQLPKHSILGKFIVTAENVSSSRGERSVLEMRLAQKADSRRQFICMSEVHERTLEACQP